MNNNNYINTPLHVVNFVASQASQSNFACAMNLLFWGSISYICCHFTLAALPPGMNISVQMRMKALHAFLINSHLPPHCVPILSYSNHVTFLHLVLFPFRLLKCPLFLVSVSRCRGWVLFTYAVEINENRLQWNLCNLLMVFVNSVISKVCLNEV